MSEQANQSAQSPQVPYTELEKVQHELEQKSAQLEQLREQTTALLGKFAHELRTSLSVVKGFAQLLETELPEDAFGNIREYAATIVTYSAQIDRLVANVLSFDQAGSARLQVQTSRHDLNPIVKHAIQSSSGLLAEKSLTVDAQLPQEPVLVVADVAMMEQALCNVIAYTAQMAILGAVLKLSVTSRDGRCIVAVTDPNRQIDAEKVSRLLEPSRTFRGETRVLFRQMDLGLAVARSIVEAHSGRIEVTSQAVGGTTVAIYLPLSNAE